MNRAGQEHKVKRAQACRHPLCKLCDRVVSRDRVVSEFRGVEYSIGSYRRTSVLVVCKAVWVVYVVTCGKCGAQYVGQTSQQVNKRAGGHRATLKAGEDKEQFVWSQDRRLVHHFTGGCGWEDMEFQVLEQVRPPGDKDDEEQIEKRRIYLREREDFWIKEVG